MWGDTDKASMVRVLTILAFTVILLSCSNLKQDRVPAQIKNARTETCSEIFNWFLFRSKPHSGTINLDKSAKLFFPEGKLSRSSFLRQSVLDTWLLNIRFIKNWMTKIISKRSLKIEGVEGLNNLLREDTVYNIIITENQVIYTSVDEGKVGELFSRHVRLAQEEEVLFAGQLWKSNEGLYLSNMGNFFESEKVHLGRAGQFLKELNGGRPLTLIYKEERLTGLSQELRETIKPVYNAIATDIDWENLPPRITLPRRRNGRWVRKSLIYKKQKVVEGEFSIFDDSKRNVLLRSGQMIQYDEQTTFRSFPIINNDGGQSYKYLDIEDGVEDLEVFAKQFKESNDELLVVAEGQYKKIVLEFEIESNEGVIPYEVEVIEYLKEDGKKVAVIRGDLEGEELTEILIRRLGAELSGLNAYQLM